MGDAFSVPFILSWGKAIPQLGPSAAETASFKEFSTGLGKGSLLAMSLRSYPVVIGLNRSCQCSGVCLFKILNIGLVFQLFFQCIVHCKNGNVVMTFVIKRDRSARSTIKMNLLQCWFIIGFTGYTSRRANEMTSGEWSYKNQNSSYRGKCQGNLNQRKGNLVRVSGEFELAEFQLLRFYCKKHLVQVFLELKFSSIRLHKEGPMENLLWLDNTY